MTAFLRSIESVRGASMRRIGTRAHSPSLVICDPYSLYASAIAAAVACRTAWQVCATFTSLEQARLALDAHKARALLFDLPNGPAATQAEEIRKLRADCPSVVLIWMTPRVDAARLRWMLGTGINACVHKSEGIDRLSTALAARAGGEPYVSPFIARCLCGRVDPVRAVPHP